MSEIIVVGYTASGDRSASFHAICHEPEIWERLELFRANHPEVVRITMDWALPYSA